MNITLYINKRCSKSNKAEDLLGANKIDIATVDLIKETPSAEKFIELARKAGLPLGDFIRSNAEKFFETGKDKEAQSEKELAEIMAAHPEVIQRPIIESKDKAIIARPPEKALDFVKNL